MTPSERRLAILIRIVGTLSVLAIVAVFMSRGWIEWCHEMLGLGPFPKAPVAEYLARSTSMFYVVLGVVHWLLSLDVRRYGRAITGVGILMVLGGITLVSIDVRAAMPWWWIGSEGPFVVALGIAYLVLQLKSRAERRAAAKSDKAAKGGVAAAPKDSPSAGA
ncbi:MAG: hypothetical protein IMZ66_06610 [Planctomycetes bacterium]|nr:hypothetical protein [Planctomycetota bacterium]